MKNHCPARPLAPVKLADTMPDRGRAFTLVELLAVIAIIGVLAALVFLATGRVRQSARTAQSLSNLRSIGVGVNLWAGDNRGKYPLHLGNVAGGLYGVGGKSWSQTVADYMGGKGAFTDFQGNTYFHNPAFVDPLVDAEKHHSMGDYGGTTELFREGGIHRRQVEISSPSQLVMAVTAGSDVRATWYLHISSYVNDGIPDVNTPNDRGTGAYLCLFADGHAKAISMLVFMENRRSLLMINP